MTREKMMDLLGLLNPASAKVLTLAGPTDEQVEFVLFHEAGHIYMAREAKNRNPKDTPVTIAYRNAAKDKQVDGEIEIDDDAAVSIGDDPGAYVRAWVWVTAEEAGICTQCGEPNADNGDGWDGMCGNCADRADNPER